MKLLKQIIYTLSNVSFRLLLIALFSIIAFTSLFHDPAYIKNTLAEQGVYENGVDALLDTNAKTTLFERSDITLGDQRVRDVLNKAFPAEDLQKISETIINRTYLWLEQDSESIDFSLDLQSNKDQLTVGFTDIAINRLKQLPICENFGQASLDPFTADCVPKEIDLEVEREAISQQIATADGLLDNPVFNDEILLGEGSDRLDSTYSQIPALYKQLSVLPVYIIILLIILATVQVLLFRSTKRGLQKLGYTIVSTTVSFLLLTLVFAVILPQFTGTIPLLQSSSVGIDGVINRVSLAISQDYTSRLLYVAIPVLFIGATIYIWTRLKKDTVSYKQAASKSGLVTGYETRDTKSSGKKRKIQRRKPPIQSSDIADRKTPKKKSTKYRTIPKKEL